MAKTTPRRGTPRAVGSKPAKPSVVEFVRNLSAEELHELRTLLTPAGDAPAREVAEPPKASRVPGKFPMKVRVKDGFTAYYDEKRWRSGDVFVVRRAKEFSARYMEPVSPDTPVQITTGKEELRKKHDEILQGRLPQGGAPMIVDDEPLAHTKNPLNA